MREFFKMKHNNFDDGRIFGWNLTFGWQFFRENGAFDMIFWGPRHIFWENWNICSIKLSHNNFDDSQIFGWNLTFGWQFFRKNGPFIMFFFVVRATFSEKIETGVQSN